MTPTRFASSAGRHARWLLTITLAAGAALPLAGCFDLRRVDDLEPGVVTGRAVRDERAVAFPAINVDGSGRTQRGGSDGGFAVRGLGEGAWTLRASVDEDGNGWPELGAFASFSLAKVIHGDAPAPRLSSVALGDVPLAATIEVRGVVRDVDDSPAAGATVTALRRFDGRDVPESSVVSDADGAFRFVGVTAGEVRFVAVSFDGARASVAADVVVADAVQDVILQLVDGDPPRVDLAVSPPLPDGTAITVSLFSASGTADVSGATDGGVVKALAVPGFGPFDVFVEQDGTGKFGALFAQVAPAGAPVTWGLVLINEENPCPRDGTARDCDSDGVQGLPFVAGEPVLPTWRACGSTCGGLTGTALQSARCEVDGATFDCDDDGDGQSDVTEPASCQNRGTDFDGDGLCGVDDRFPQCAENDAADPACGAAAVGTARNPPVREEFGGGGGEGEGEGEEGEGEGEGEEGEGEGEGEGGTPPFARAVHIVAPAPASDVHVQLAGGDVDGDPVTYAIVDGPVIVDPVTGEATAVVTATPTPFTYSVTSRDGTTLGHGRIAAGVSIWLGGSGADPGDSGDADNWVPSGVPGADAVALVPADDAVRAPLAIDVLDVDRLTIETGANVTLERSLEVHRGIVVDGALVDGDDPAGGQLTLKAPGGFVEGAGGVDLSTLRLRVDGEVNAGGWSLPEDAVVGELDVVRSGLTVLTLDAQRVSVGESGVLVVAQQGILRAVDLSSDGFFNFDAADVAVAGSATFAGGNAVEGEGFVIGGAAGTASLQLLGDAIALSVTSLTVNGDATLAGFIEADTVTSIGNSVTGPASVDVGVRLDVDAGWAPDLTVVTGETALPAAIGGDVEFANIGKSSPFVGSSVVVGGRCAPNFVGFVEIPSGVTLRCGSFEGSVFVDSGATLDVDGDAIVEFGASRGTVVFGGTASIQSDNADGVFVFDSTDDVAIDSNFRVGRIVSAPGSIQRLQGIWAAGSLRVDGNFFNGRLGSGSVDDDVVIGAAGVLTNNNELVVVGDIDFDGGALVNNSVIELGGVCLDEQVDSVSGLGGNPCSGGASPNAGDTVVVVPPTASQPKRVALNASGGVVRFPGEPPAHVTYDEQTNEIVVAPFTDASDPDVVVVPFEVQSGQVVRSANVIAVRSGLVWRGVSADSEDPSNWDDGEGAGGRVPGGLDLVVVVDGVDNPLVLPPADDTAWGAVTVTANATVDLNGGNLGVARDVVVDGADAAIENGTVLVGRSDGSAANVTGRVPRLVVSGEAQSFSLVADAIEVVGGSFLLGGAIDADSLLVTDASVLVRSSVDIGSIDVELGGGFRCEDGADVTVDIVGTGGAFVVAAGCVVAVNTDVSAFDDGLVTIDGLVSVGDDVSASGNADVVGTGVLRFVGADQLHSFAFTFTSGFDGKLEVAAGINTLQLRNLDEQTAWSVGEVELGEDAVVEGGGVDVEIGGNLLGPQTSRWRPTSTLFRSGGIVVVEPPLQTALVFNGVGVTHTLLSSTTNAGACVVNSGVRLEVGADLHCQTLVNNGELQMSDAQQSIEVNGNLIWNGTAPLVEAGTVGAPSLTLRGDVTLFNTLDLSAVALTLTTPGTSLWDNNNNPIAVTFPPSFATPGNGYNAVFATDVVFTGATFTVAANDTLTFDRGAWGSPATTMRLSGAVVNRSSGSLAHLTFLGGSFVSDGDAAFVGFSTDPPCDGGAMTSVNGGLDTCSTL